jgi:hypothetical protein
MVNAWTIEHKKLFMLIYVMQIESSSIKFMLNNSFKQIKEFTYSVLTTPAALDFI